MGIIKRSDENPILVPAKDHSWESEAVFNGCPIKRGTETHLLYRAVSSLHYHAYSETQLRVSTIGHATSRDGLHFHGRHQLIIPEEKWEKYGCEDPRVTKLNGKYFIFYTALSTNPLTPDGIKVAVAITKNFKKVEEKHLVTPFNAKAMALFPELIDGKIYAILTANTDKPPSAIGIASFKNESEIWSERYWDEWYETLPNHTLPLQRTNTDQVEVGTPPIKTSKGWLILYSHIKNYFSGNKIFGIEAVLLDLKNPMKIIGRTTISLMTPEEEYEIYGQVPNIVFPSGALVKGNMLRIYYGATDSTCCVATCSLSQLLRLILPSAKSPELFLRYKGNPILTPRQNIAWEKKAVFNPGAFSDGKKTHILYRAMGDENTSVMGYATTTDGVTIDYQSDAPAYIPRESFEAKKVQGGNSGCEDPRLTKIGNVVYMCYTAYDGTSAPRVAFTSIPFKKFLKQEWNEWTKPVLLSSPNIDDKDACLFPKKIKGNYLIFHRIGNSVDISITKDLTFKSGEWLEEHLWLTPRKGSWDSLKVGIAAPPLETSAGWILLYHGISEEHHTYRVGAVLLDKRDPEQIIGRTNYPIFEPTAPYELQGQVQNVVFPCGAVIKGKKLFMYYGGADSVVGVATTDVAKIVKLLKQSSYSR